jgi:sec-independent protein translocase protein TatC
MAAAHRPAPYDGSPDPDDRPGAGAMPFLEHLDELRKRLLVSVAALGVGFVVCWVFVERLLDFIFVPLTATIAGGKFQYTEPAEAFMLRMKLAALAGLFLALPVILWQVWRFVAPGLYRDEKRLAIPFVLLSTVLFTLGAAFSHYVAFPWTMQFFASFERPDIVFIPRIAPVFETYVKMLLGMGLAFQLPTVVFFLARLGLVTAGFLVRHFKYGVLLIFVVAAIATPGQDFTSQFMMAGPMLVLYVLSIAIAWVVGRRRRRAIDA